jgi:hypothetical protein
LKSLESKKKKNKQTNKKQQQQKVKDGTCLSTLEISTLGKRDALSPCGRGWFFSLRCVARLLEFPCDICVYSSDEGSERVKRGRGKREGKERQREARR